MSADSPKRILLLSQARTACHLLERLLSNQSNVAYHSHPFIPARLSSLKLLQQGPMNKTDEETKKELMNDWQIAFTSSWEPFFSQASQEGKIAFLHLHPSFSLQPALAAAYVYGNGDAGSDYEQFVVKSADGDDAHSFDNPQVVPDAQLLVPGTIPLLTIRHPALMVPSIVRTMRDVSAENFADESVVFSCSLRWQRLLYDFYVKHGAAKGIKPLVLDAEDYQGPDREAYMGRLCDAIGLNKEEVSFTWAKASEEELKQMPSMVVEIKKTILGSEGVIEGRGSASMDAKAEEAKWDGVFGKDRAQFVKKLVNQITEDYEYLRARKF